MEGKEGSKRDTRGKGKTMRKKTQKMKTRLKLKWYLFLLTYLHFFN